MASGATTNVTPVSDRDQRLAFFDDADKYTHYLATLADGSVFLVS